MRLSTGGWVLVAASAVAVGLLAPTATTLTSDLTGSSFPDAALAAASLVVLAIASWSLLAAATILLGASSRVVRAITPAALRRALLAGAAGALTITPAHADQLPAPDTQQHVVSGLALPDRPDSPASTHRASTPRAVSTGDGPTTQVRVRAGDTLWAIAARSLPDGASDADVAAATTAWHRANVDVIGDDPDLIVPAQLLVPPSGKDLS